MHSFPLIEADLLHADLLNKDTVILDATFTLPNQGRLPRHEFESCHLPGAQFFDIEEIKDTGNPLPHMLPKPEDFATAAGALGIGEDTRVILYDNHRFMASARAWWMFRVFGHDNVRILDGGLARWLQMGYETESLNSSPRPQRQFSARFQKEWVSGFEDLHQNLKSGQYQVIDARPAGRFEGLDPEPRPGLRQGHIPGSRNLPFSDLIDEKTGQLLEKKALEQAFLSRGCDPQLPTITTCGSGVTAAILALGLYCLREGTTAVYDGSWAEWGLPGSHPVATGISEIVQL